MRIEIDPHARERMETRGASEEEVYLTVIEGEHFPAKHGRQGFRRNFAGQVLWRGKLFGGKQVEAYAVVEDEVVTVITVIVRYLSKATP